MRPRLHSGLFWLLALFALNQAQAQTPNPADGIQKLCKNTRDLIDCAQGENKRVSDQNLCALEKAFPLDQKIASMVKKIRSDIKSGNNPSIESKQDLEELANAVTEHARPDPKQKNPLALSIDRLAQNYPNPTLRNLKQTPYIHDLMSFLQQTDTGKKITECFKKDADPTFFEPGYEILSPSEAKLKYGEDFSKTTMQFINIKPKGSQKRKRLIVFNTEIPPIEASLLLIHEMQHGCDAKSFFASCSTQKNTCDRDRIGLEAKGYFVAQTLFKELAKADPGMVCNQAYVSPFLGNQVVTLADYYYFIEKNIDSGEFSKWQAIHYIEKGFYNFDSVMEWSPGSPFGFKLKPEVLMNVLNTMKSFKKSMNHQPIR